MIDKDLSWHDIDRYCTVTLYINDIFSSFPDTYERIRAIAYAIKARIEDIDPFIQQNTEEVCPDCEERCCINRHGYYDNLDILYIMALRIKPPSYREDMSDVDPCQFLSDWGCKKERYLRPFRCNWYFCETLLNHMENGLSRHYREFIRTFNEILDMRNKLLDEFLREIKRCQTLR